MKIAFIAPDPGEFISGGNLYNSSLTKALITTGAHVDIIQEMPRLSDRYDYHILDSIYFHKTTISAIPAHTYGLIHHLGSLYPMSSDAFESDDRPVLDQLEGYIVSSSFVREYLAKKGYSRNSITVLEPVAPPLTKTARYPVTKVKAVMLNNLVDRKGVLDFLMTLASAGLSPFFSLNIIGSLEADSQYSSACLELVRNDPNLHRTVRFLGAQDYEAILSIMQKSNLFISASKMETFGMSIQEANLQGLPLLVCEGGYAAHHVIPGKNGWRARDIREAVSIFERLVSSPPELDSIARTAYDLDITQRYALSWSDSAEALLQFLEK